MKINIAIIGLGRVGSILLQQMIKYKKKGVNIIAVAEISETPGKILALKEKINITSMEEIVKFGNKIDLIFELTGKVDVRHRLRNLLKESNNNYTVIVTEIIATLICMLETDKILPDVHEYKGY